MGSRERETTTTTAPPPHQHHHLSSLVVRPAESGGGGGGGGGSDYEPGEVRRDPPPYSRPDRFHENSGHGMRAGSGSPLRHRKFDYHYRSDFDHSGPPPRGHGFRGGRGPGRFRDPSPPYGRGRGGGRHSARDFDGPGFGHGPPRGEGMSRNNPNVSPREGDWICPDPSCGNLNFARRDYCNNCNRLRIGPRDSPRRNYSGPPRFSGMPIDYSPPGRGMNGYRSSPPPRSWGRDGPREFGAGPPHPRYGGKFPDHPIRRERPDFREEDDYRERIKFDRPMPPDFHSRDRGRDNFKERRGYDGRNERRPLTPPGPPPPPRGRWARDVRERSRSPPMRNGGPPVDFRRDSYVERGRDNMDRGRDNRWGGMPRDRVADDPPY